MVTEKMIEALKPCPFCGGEPLEFRVPGYGKLWRIECKSCDAGPASSLNIEDTRTIWNARFEAALSTDAEPVRWMITETMPTGSKCWKVVEHEHQANEEAKSWRVLLKDVAVVPLYAAPPAPSVAVKAGPDSYACDQCGHVISHDAIVPNDVWEKISPSKDEGGTLCANCIVEKLDYAAALISDAHAVPALSAQVQDVDPVGQVDASYGNEGMLVACFTPSTLPVGTKLFTAPPAQSVAIPEGWQLIPKEPTREMWAAMANTLYGYKNRHHDKVAGDLFQAMLAAAPAAKLEEKQ